MATALYFVERAMSRIGVKTAEIPLEADEAQAGLDMLNDMLSSWEIVTPMGFVAVENLTDEVRAQRGFNGAIIDNLAVYAGPEFQKSPNPALIATARALRDQMMTQLVKIGRVEYPDTLPVGSGNQCGDTYYDDRFFPKNSTENF